MAHAGLDTAVYPGDEVLANLFNATNLSFVAYYLRAPSHHDTSFMGKRATIIGQGWGTAPVYVGQQAHGPGSSILTEQQGLSDGAIAARLMGDEGFADGSYVFLDVEGVPMPPEQEVYVTAWVDAVHAANFGAGVYCGHLIAERVAEIVPSARLWVVKVPSTAPFDFPGTTFPNDDPAVISGIPGAFMCQCREEARLTDFGNLAVDLDTCVQKDPSAP